MAELQLNSPQPALPPPPLTEQKPVTPASSPTPAPTTPTPTPDPNPTSKSKAGLVRIIFSALAILLALYLAYLAALALLVVVIVDTSSSGFSQYTETALTIYPLWGLFPFLLACGSWLSVCIGLKQFKLKNNPLGLKSKIFLGVFTVLITLPLIGLVGYGYLRGVIAGDGYAIAQQQVAFHVYKPTVLPTGFIVLSKYQTGKELFPGTQTAVQVAVGTPIKELAEGGESQSVVIRQDSVDSNFDLDTFAQTFMNDAAPQAVAISIAKNQSGYLYERPLGTATVTILLFITEDDVVISLGSMDKGSTGKDVLLEIAEGLQ